MERSGVSTGRTVAGESIIGGPLDSATGFELRQFSAEN